MIIANWIAFIIILIGALNWGLLGIFGFNLVTFICMGSLMFSRVIYILVLIAAIWLIISAAMSGGILLTAGLIAAA